jgi:hypothetical protein
MICALRVQNPKSERETLNGICAHSAFCLDEFSRGDDTASFSGNVGSSNITNSITRRVGLGHTKPP